MFVLKIPTLIIITYLLEEYFYRVPNTLMNKKTSNAKDIVSRQTILSVENFVQVFKLVQ